MNRFAPGATPNTDGATTGASTPSFLGREWVTLFALWAVAAVALLPYRHFAGDDAHISFRFAQNVATSHGFAFNPDQPTYGSTSPLWVFVMAGLYRLGLAIGNAAHLLNAICVVLLVAAFWRLTRYYIAAHWVRALATVLLVIDPWFVHWAMSGMENALALFLLCAAILAQERQRNTTHLSVWAPLCCGLGLLTRPEFAVFSALLVTDTFLFERAARAKKLAAYVIVLALVVLPWFAFAWQQFGSIVPNTVRAKLSANRAAALLGTAKYFASFFAFELAGLALLLGLGFAQVHARLRDRDVRERWFLPLTWTVALPAFYIAGGAPVSGRYLVLGLPTFLLVGVKGWEMLLGLRDRLPWARAATATLAVLTVALVMGVQAKYVFYITAWRDGMDPRMFELAKWLRANAAPDDLVAADQIGVIGYVSERPILDLVGLVSPEMQAPQRAGRRAFWEAVKQANPQWIVVLDDKAHLAAVVPEMSSLDLVGVYEVQREGAQSVGMSQAYKLYRTGWRRNEPKRASSLP